jgi:tetratricopeptide (TPR) repeat protein
MTEQRTTSYIPVGADVSAPPVYSTSDLAARTSAEPLSDGVDLRGSSPPVAGPTSEYAAPTLDNLLLKVQRAGTAALRAGLNLQRSPFTPAATSLRSVSVDLQQAAVEVQEVGLELQNLLHGFTSSARPSVVAHDSVGDQGATAEAVKPAGDELMAIGSFEQAVTVYQRALSLRPTHSGVEDNLAVALLMGGKYTEAEDALRRKLQRDRGLPSERLERFRPAEQSPEAIAPASPFKLTDRMDQLDWLIEHDKLDASFTRLVDAYRDLRDELVQDTNRAPYAPLSAEQVGRLGGYYDRLLHYRETPALPTEAVNPNLDFGSLQERYRAERALYFDDLLTPEALRELQAFFRESTVFFRHSEAGFVGSYITDGAVSGVLLQIVAELQQNLPDILGGLPLNNMWCYRYDSRGDGVRAHNGDGSVTLNFWLTPDDANVADSEGGGLIMYDKTHPAGWDWAMINARKDDPVVREQIHDYLADANSFAIPYRCNRAALFHSTLFHKTDPFAFRDRYVDRRLNITLLFGRRAEESVVLA